MTRFLTLYGRHVRGRLIEMARYAIEVSAICLLAYVLAMVVAGLG